MDDHGWFASHVLSSFEAGAVFAESPLRRQIPLIPQVSKRYATMAAFACPDHCLAVRQPPDATRDCHVVDAWCQPDWFSRLSRIRLTSLFQSMLFWSLQARKAPAGPRQTIGTGWSRIWQSYYPEKYRHWAANRHRVTNQFATTDVYLALANY